MNQRYILPWITAALTGTSACLSQQDLGSNPAPSTGCEAGARFGETSIQCGDSAADLDLTVGAPIQQALLRGQVRSFAPTRFGKTQFFPIKIRNFGQTPATDLKIQLQENAIDSAILEIVSAQDTPSSVPNPCSTRIEANEECNLTLRFSPQGKPYSAQTWAAQLSIVYQDGRTTQQVDYPIETQGELCAQQNLGLHFEAPSLSDIGRLESDRVRITQSIRSADFNQPEPELSRFSIPLRLSRKGTQFEKLILSIHGGDPSSKDLPARDALIETELSFDQFEESEYALQPEIDDLVSLGASRGTALQWVHFTFPEPVKLPNLPFLYWSLRTEGLKNGAILYGKVDDLEESGAGYPGGIAGTWVFPSVGNPEYTALPYRDIEFQFQQCQPLSSI